VIVAGKDKTGEVSQAKPSQAKTRQDKTSAMQTAAWREDTKKMKKNALKFGFVSSRTFTHTHMYIQLTATVFNKNEL
jgi:hypothetical protein